MNMHKTEDHHNTVEQVVGYTRDAVKVADEAGLSDADRAVLLPTILAQLASKQVFYEQVPSSLDLGRIRPQG